MASLAALAALPRPAWSGARSRRVARPRTAEFGFDEVRAVHDEHLHLPDDHRAQVMLRWGDPLFPHSSRFDPARQSAASQESQVGFNNDFIAYLPLPRGGRSSSHGLLGVSHEYTISELMFPDGRPARLTPPEVEVEIAAHGHSVVEIRRGKDGWQVDLDSRYNRRLSAWSTRFELKGPVAGHRRVRTSTDPDGRFVIGTLNNCSGGVTPWHTVLFCEENFNFYFSGRHTPEETRSHQRYEVAPQPNDMYPGWARDHRRFDVSKEPHEPNRFGWVVEYDPHDPGTLPVKRTALGRFKHETSTVVQAPDGRVVVYSGDDERFEYLYRFVSDRVFDPEEPRGERDILDHGVLSVARFHESGTMQWLPLVFGEGPLTRKNGFGSQADVLIETRRAADLVGATPLDRPEGITVDPLTGCVYVALTKNEKRVEEGPASPRVKNDGGHILELRPPSRSRRSDHCADRMRWDILLMGGKPGRDPGADFGPGTSDDGWFTCPDNVVFGPDGRLWIGTDNYNKGVGPGDGLYVCLTTGEDRASVRRFLAAPRGAEITGPCFTPDGSTLFVSIQHPGEGSSIEKPSTRWPDFDPDLPPRSAVVAITREGGGPVGS